MAIVQTRARLSDSGKVRRVLIIVENLPVPFDRRVWSEAITLTQAGYQVSIICPRGNYPGGYEFLEGIHVYRHPVLPEGKGKLAYLREYILALSYEFFYSLRVLFTHGFDVVHACNPPDLIFIIGGFYKYLFRKKFIFDHHDLNPELFEAKFNRRGFFWNLLRLCERMTFAVADVSIATNESYRQIAIERGRMSPDRVFTVRSGPNLDRVRELPPDTKWRNGRAHLVAYVGVIGESEGLDLLLESVAHILRKGRNDIQFVVMGSGPAWDSISEMTNRMGLSDCVTLTGRVDDQTLFTVLSTADVCVNPDVPNPMNDKSTMNKIMEYMALGKPIVQYSVTEGRVSAGDTSLYAKNTDVADFGNKILELIDDPERRRKMGELGKLRVRNELAWTYSVPHLLAAYDKVFRAS